MPLFISFSSKGVMLAEMSFSLFAPSAEHSPILSLLNRLDSKTLCCQTLASVGTLLSVTLAVGTVGTLACVGTLLSRLKDTVVWDTG